MDKPRPFWESRSLAEMSAEEWESLCDGCAKCCLHKLEDEQSGEVHYTRVACRYLDQDTCRCNVYEQRKQLVPGCVKLEAGNFDKLHWMPSSCAYRLLNEGKVLPLWHSLISGSRRAIAESGNTVTGKVISDEFVHEDGFEEHIVHWLK